MPIRDDIRNVAIVAHVDHGKTTLVDAMLLQSGAYSEHQQEEGAVQDRVMDSMDLEREKGITILAKNTAVRRKDLLININKVDRSDARIAEVVDETYELFLDLDATEDQIDFPIVYCQAKTGQASLNRPADGSSPDQPNLDVLFDVIKNTIPAPSYDEDASLQAHVTN